MVISRPIPNRSPISRILTDVNMIIRRARALEAAGLHVSAAKRGLSQSHRAGLQALRRSGRASLHNMKCGEMRPMSPGLYYAASDAILVALVRSDLDTVTREVILSDWSRINSSVEEARQSL